MRKDTSRPSRCGGLAPDFVGGAWWVDLAKLGDASFLANAIAAALAIKEGQGERLLDIVARRLRQGSTLLLLDNCEHVIADCAALVHELLDACPSLSCLTTSREPLGVDGEIAWRVPALRVPAEQASAAQVASCEAVRLFGDRASQVQQDFRITEENAGAVAAICIRLDGIPLAIELAAARMRMLTAAQILAGLKDRFRLLTGGMRTTLPRHRTLRASVDLLGYCLALQGRLARAQTCLRESLAIARRLRDRVFEAQSLFSLGLIDALRGEPTRAEALLEESIDIARESSPLMVAFALLTHGLARYVAGDINGCRPRLVEALALARKMSLPWVTSWSLAFLGNAARMSGCLDEADEHIQEALALMKSKGLRTDVPIDAAAGLARAVGDLDLAESLHHDALKTAHAIDSVLLVPAHFESLAGLAGLAGRFHEAARLFGAAEAAREAQGSSDTLPTVTSTTPMLSESASRFPPWNFARLGTKGVRCLSSRPARIVQGDVASENGLRLGGGV